MKAYVSAKLVYDNAKVPNIEGKSLQEVIAHRPDDMEGLIQAVDNLNYYMMSKSELTEFLYCYISDVFHSVEWIIEHL
jgi:hypothetical protein